MTVKITLKMLAYLPDYKGPRITVIEVPENIEAAIETIKANPALSLKKGFGTQYFLLVNGRLYQHVLKDNVNLKDNDVLAFVSMVSGG